jgi:hypothetical protein
MNIRDLIRRYNEEILNHDLTPDRASEILVEVSALVGNINDEIKKTEMAYNNLLLSYLESEPKANRAKIKVDCSPENESKIEARNTMMSADYLIKSLKYYLRTKESEYKHSGNM